MADTECAAPDTDVNAHAWAISMNCRLNMHVLLCNVGGCWCCISSNDGRYEDAF